jgi:hypothetical protein
MGYSVGTLVTKRLLVLLSAALLAGVASLGSRGRPPEAGGSSRLVPESERTMRRLILGLQANEMRLQMLPETASWDPRSRDPRVIRLRRQLYRIAFEMAHGQIFRSAPSYTQFFIAVPEPGSTPDSLGDEEEIFREHMRERLGWSEAAIQQRVHFFRVPLPVPYPQDMAEPIAYDESARLVLGIGADADEPYRRAVESLVRAYPADFVLRELSDINTEGGDLALVRLPEGTIGLMIGHNRIERWVRRTRQGSRSGEPISAAEIEAARRAYRRAFGVADTIVIGVESLRNPALANPEIFHVDMVAAVLKTASGVVAFVPTYSRNPIDALTHVHLDEDAVARFQAEYDRAERQLVARGYRVARVPFADHPARNPVGIGKYVDVETGRPSVLLGRYPEHLTANDEGNVQTQLQLALEGLDNAVGAWRGDRSDIRWRAVQDALATVWRRMDRTAEAPNPMYEDQRRVYESFGIDVVGLPIFATGEGGVHCLTLK